MIWTHGNEVFGCRYRLKRREMHKLMPSDRTMITQHEYIMDIWHWLSGYRVPRVHITCLCCANERRMRVIVASRDEIDKQVGTRLTSEFSSSRIAESMLKCGSLILDLPSNTLSSILIVVSYPSVIHRANSLHLMRHYLRDFCMACLVTNETSAAVLDAE